MTRVCFIGVNGILFEIFGPLKPLSADEPLVTLKQAFLTRQFTLLKDAINFVEDIQRLSMLTNRQKQCLKALKVYGDVHAASRYIGLSEKTVYKLIANAGVKLNLYGLIKVKRFVHNNKIVSNER